MIINVGSRYSRVADLGEIDVSGVVAFEIVAVFLLSFAVIVALVLWFTRRMAKDRETLEVKKRQLEIYDKHFDEIVRVECPYCKTLYAMERETCPNCGAETKNIRMPKMPE